MTLRKTNSAPITIPGLQFSWRRYKIQDGVYFSGLEVVGSKKIETVDLFVDEMSQKMTARDDFSRSQPTV
jgi:hypothetical protein